MSDLIILGICGTDKGPISFIFKAKPWCGQGTIFAKFVKITDL